MHIQSNETSAALATELVHQLAALLQARLGSRVRDFQVFALDGGLVLTGRTDTYYAKQVAQCLATEICSVPIVANEIEVE